MWFSTYSAKQSAIADHDVWAMMRIFQYHTRFQLLQVSTLQCVPIVRVSVLVFRLMALTRYFSTILP